jgi:hypothetical protein
MFAPSVRVALQNLLQQYTLLSGSGGKAKRFRFPPCPNLTPRWPNYRGMYFSVVCFLL